MLHVWKKRQEMSAFTLIELLVVISIISLLISILLPALGAARQSAQAIKCSTMLKSLGMANAIYASDGKGWQVPNTTWGIDNGFVTGGSGSEATVNWYNITGFRQALNWPMSISGDKWYSTPLSSVCPNATYAFEKISSKGYVRMSYTYGQNIMTKSAYEYLSGDHMDHLDTNMRAFHDSKIKPIYVKPRYM